MSLDEGWRHTFSGNYTNNCLEKQGKSRKPFVRLPCNVAEIRAGYLPSTKILLKHNTALWHQVLLHFQSQKKKKICKHTYCGEHKVWKKLSPI
jgi:hypothetical protein